MKILIVDDEEIICRAYQKELELSGFEVRTAGSGNFALKILKDYPADIALVDLVMPEMNGVELCKKIKQVSPRTEVVLVSGYPKEIEQFQMEFLAAGGRDFWLRKPLGEDELTETVKRISTELAKGGDNE